MATSEIDILLEAKDNASAAIRRTADETERLTKSAGSFNAVGSTMTAGFVAMSAALGGIVSAGAAVKSAMDFEQTSASFETMLGNVDQARALLGQLSQFAAQTPFEFPEIANAGKSLLAFGVAAGDITTTLRQIGDVAAGVNVPLGELSEIYGKARVQGRLFAEDINQLQGRGIPIVQELAKVFGVAESEVKKMVEAGKVGFPEMQKAFVNLTAEGGKFNGMMMRQSTTMAGLLSTASDAVMQLGRDIIGISSTGEVRAGSLFETMRNGIAGFIDIVNRATPSILQFTNGMGVIIGGLANTISSIFNGIVNTIVWMGQNFDTVMRVVVAGAVGLATSVLFVHTNAIASVMLGYVKLGAQMALNTTIAIAQAGYYATLNAVQTAWLLIQTVSIKTIATLGVQMVLNNTIAAAQAVKIATLTAVKTAWNIVQGISIKQMTLLAARTIYTTTVATLQAGAISVLAGAKIAWNAVMAISGKRLLSLGKNILMTTARVALMSVAFLGIALVVAGVVVAVYKNWDNLKKKLAPIFEYIAGIGQKVPDLIASAWNALVGVVAGSIKMILSSTKTVGEWLSKMGVNIIDPAGVQETIDRVSAFSESIKFSGQDVKAAFGSIKDSAIGAFSAVVESIGAVDFKFPKPDLGPINQIGEGAKNSKDELEKLAKRIMDVAETARTQFTTVSEKIGDQKKKIADMRGEYDKLKEKLREVGEAGKKELAKIDEQLTKQAQKIAGIQGQGALDIGGRAIDIESELKAKAEEKKQLEKEWIDLQAKSATMSSDQRNQEETAIINKQAALQLERDKLEAELKLAQTTITSAEMQKARDEAAKSETQKIIERTVARLDEAEVERAEIIKTRAEKLISIEAEKTEVKKQMDEKQALIMREKRLYGSLIAERMSLDSLYFNTFGAQIEKQMIKTKEAIQLMRELQQEGLAVSGARAEGGPVSKGSTYLVGENGPELFTPKSSGNITPNNELGGVTITIQNITVGQGQDPRSVGKIVAEEIARQMQLGKKGIYA